MKNKLFKKADVLLLGAVLLLAGALFALRADGKGRLEACVYESGRLVQQIDLHALEGVETISCANGHMTLQAEKGQIRVLASDCNSQICVHTGVLQKAGDTAVCIPNQVTVTLRCAKEQQYQTY